MIMPFNSLLHWLRWFWSWTERGKGELGITLSILLPSIIQWNIPLSLVSSRISSSQGEEGRKHTVEGTRGRKSIRRDEVVDDSWPCRQHWRVGGTRRGCSFRDIWYFHPPHSHAAELRLEYFQQQQQHLKNDAILYIDSFNAVSIILLQRIWFRQLWEFSFHFSAGVELTRGGACDEIRKHSGKIVHRNYVFCSYVCMRQTSANPNR